MNYSSKSVSSGSTQTSSIFSNDHEDYDTLIREIEEYYIRTLLNEDDEEVSTKDQATYSNWAYFSNVQRIPGMEARAGFGVSMDEEFLRYETRRCSQSSQHRGSGSGLEVEINSQYRPATGVIPLTSENLRMISESLSSTIEMGTGQENGIKIAGDDVVSPKKTLCENKESSYTVAEQHEKVNRQLYKTELCESFSTRGVCKYGEKCQFAHGLHELKLKERSNNFRTKPCLNWTKYGYCRYGKRCCFKHGEDKDIEVYLQAGTIKKAVEPPKKRNDHANVKVLQKITW